MTKRSWNCPLAEALEFQYTAEQRDARIHLKKTQKTSFTEYSLRIHITICPWL